MRLLTLFGRHGPSMKASDRNVVVAWRCARSEMACLAMLIAVLGCGSNNQAVTCELEISNDSARQVWVESILGFKGDCRCGYLMPGAEASISATVPQQLPKSIIIQWWVGDRQRPADEESIFKSEIGLPELSNLANLKNSRLKLILMQDNSWKVSWTK